MDLPQDAPAPRLCHLIKWQDFDGYGFNLHAEKNKANRQFVGKVDENSPAQSAGLREGDCIIEVNGVNISTENHRQVVERIKAIATETKLLVIDQEGDSWYRSRELLIKSSQANVIHMKTQVPRALSVSSSDEGNKINGVQEESVVVSEAPATESPVQPAVQEETKCETPAPAETRPVESPVQIETTKTESPVPTEKPTIESPIQNETTSIETPVRIETPTMVSSSPSPPTFHDLSISPRKLGDEVNSNAKVTAKMTNGHAGHGSRESSETTGSIPASPTSLKSSGSTGNGLPSDVSSTGSTSLTLNNNNGKNATKADSLTISLNMSVSEMRQMLAQKKKNDPKKVPMDLRQKYEIIQQM